MHRAVVEVNATAGRISIRDYCAVDDCGTIINPLILEEQIHGGIAQGVGQVLMEHLVIDPNTGQVLSGSFMDYAMPRMVDFPRFHLDFQESPTLHNVIGCKGGGDGGAIGPPAAVGNAVVHAFWHLGVRDVEMPMTSLTVWHAIREAEGPALVCGDSDSAPLSTTHD